MLDINDLAKIQQLINIKGQELFSELLRVGSDLSEHITENFVRRTSGIKDVHASKQIYFTQDHNSKKYIRNSKCWASDIDLTCISPWNSFGKNHRAGTAITKHHIVYASHYSLPINTIIRFISKNNEVIERKISKTKQIFNTDITIALLNEALPDSITPASLFPRNWNSYLATVYNHFADTNTGVLVKSIPVICLDHEEKANINSLNGISDNKNVGCNKAIGNLEAFSEQIVSGDSGNPCFTIIDNKLILLTTWNFGGYGSGPFLSGDTFLTSEMKLKNNLQEIQNQIHKELMPSSITSMTDIIPQIVDLWRFRKV